MFGGKPNPTPGFTFGATPSAGSTQATGGGFSFGTPSTQATGNVSFGAAVGQTPAAGPTSSFSFGATPTASTGGFKLGGTTPSFPSTQSSTAAPTTGFALGTSTASTQSGGFKIGATTLPPAFPGTTSTAPGTTATVAPAMGFAMPIPSSTATGGGGLGLGMGLGGAVKPSLTSTTSTLGGLFNTQTPAAKPAGILGATTATGSVFGTPATTSQTVGLGGVDPKTSTTAAGGSAADQKAGDGKTLKKSQVPPEIVKTVEDFKTYIKEEKTVQEGISRMSCKPMYKVQEDVASLKQLLSIVSNGLQRNACAVEKLKKEMTQELKNAEMAQRTKDIPAGLQYENTAPTEYFQRLVENFETQMLSYRQQIETLEGHLHSISQPSILSPEELVELLRKLHETFIALAAQLHQVHEAVKTQKEHYLNYRKIFLHDTKNIFEREKKAVKPKVLPEHFGPSPFSGLSNAAAVAMASALTKSQQPPAAAPPVAGLGTLGQTTGGFGSTGLFGATTTTAPAFGFGLGSSSTTGPPPAFGGFGSTAAATTTTSSGFTGLNTATVRPLV